MANFDDLVMDPVAGVTPDHPEQHGLIALLLKQLQSEKNDAEGVRDVVGNALVAGANITIDVSDAGDSIMISASGGASVTFATNAETIAGASTTLAVNPAGVAAAISGKVSTEDVAGLSAVGWARAVYIPNGGTIPVGTPDYTLVIEFEA